jgi:hypothetical protein
MVMMNLVRNFDLLVLACLDSWFSAFGSAAMPDSLLNFKLAIEIVVAQL